MPKAAWDSLSAGEKAATNRAKRKGTKAGKQHVKQPKKVAKKPRVKSRKLRKRTKIRGGSNHQVTGIQDYTPVNTVVTKPQRSNTTNSTVALYEEPEGLYATVGPKQEDHPNYQSELLKKMDEKLDKIISRLLMLDQLVEASVFDKNNDKPPRNLPGTEGGTSTA